MASSSNSTAIVVGAVAVVVVGALLLVGGSAKAKPTPKPNPQPQPNPQPEPQPEPQPQPQPEPQPEPEDDLVTNWGGIPMELRVWLVAGEQAAKIPGMARALAVKWWQAYRAGQPVVSTEEAAAIAAANPELCRTCFNGGDAWASKKLIDDNVKAGRPMPADYAGYAAGSGGLGDILGANIAYAGVLTGKTLPFINMNAKEARERYDVQLTTAASIIRQILASPKYSVLVPGPNSAAGDSAETWSNIFSAWAGPDDYAKGNQDSKDRKARYLARAAEIGVDLSQVAYPWPPGTSYKVPGWTVQKVWQRLQEMGGQPVVDPAPDQAPPNQGVGVVLELPGGVRGYPRIQTQEEVAPLIVAFHGRQADEKQLMDRIPKDLGARVVFLRGPMPDPQGGRLWFGPRLTDPDGQVAPALRDATLNAAAVIRSLTAKYKTSRIVAVGFSQGAAMVLSLAALGAVDAAVAASGMLPASLRPKGPADVLVMQLQGGADQVVPEKLAHDTWDAFVAAGYPDPTYSVDATVGHKLPSLGTLASPLYSGSKPRGDNYTSDLGFYISDDCKLHVTNRGAATIALTERLLDVARQGTGFSGKAVTRDDLLAFINAFFAEIAPLCALGDKPFADGESARLGYWALRSALRALVLRGLLGRTDAASLLTDLASGAKALGVGAIDLPPLDL